MPVGSAVPAFKVGAVDITSIDTAKKHETGTKVICNDGTERTYFLASGAIAQFDAVTLSGATPAFGKVKSTDAVAQPVFGVNPLTGVADTNFFWAISGGPVVVKAATVVALSSLITDGTSGRLDDIAGTAANALAAGSGKGVWSITADGTPAAGQCRAILS